MNCVCGNQIVKPVWPDQWLLHTCAQMPSQYNHIICKYDWWWGWGEWVHRGMWSIKSCGGVTARMCMCVRFCVCSPCLYTAYVSVCPLFCFGFYHNLIPPPICSQRRDGNLHSSSLFLLFLFVCSLSLSSTSLPLSVSLLHQLLFLFSSNPSSSPPSHPPVYPLLLLSSSDTDRMKLSFI